MGHNVAWWLGEIIWGGVVASLITFVIYLVVDYKRQSRKS